MARTKQNIPAGETKRQKFRRVSGPRIDAIVGAMRRLAKLGVAAYERHPDDLKRLVTVIDAQWKETQTALQPKAASAGGAAKASIWDDAA